MKTIALCLSLILTSITFLSCVKEDLRIVPSNQVTTEYYSVSDPGQLDISDPFQVYVQFSGTEQELRIEANDNLHSLIEVKEVNGKLSIQLNEDFSKIDGTPVLKVFLTTKDLESIKADGLARVYLQNDWNENKPVVNISGASSLEGVITANELTANVSGASTLAIQGNAQTFDITVSGASGMTGFDFDADKLVANLTGGSNVTLTVNEELNVTATGASTVYYQGEGVIHSQNLSGGSEIIKQ